jgi:hypothetical protein
MAIWRQKYDELIIYTRNNIIIYYNNGNIIVQKWCGGGMRLI